MQQTAEHQKKPPLTRKVLVAFVRPNVQKSYPPDDADGGIFTNGNEFIMEFDRELQPAQVRVIEEMEAGRDSNGKRTINQGEMKVIKNRPSAEMLAMTKDQHGVGRKDVFWDLFQKVS